MVARRTNIKKGRLITKNIKTTDLAGYEGIGHKVSLLSRRYYSYTMKFAGLNMCCFQQSDEIMFGSKKMF